MSLDFSGSSSRPAPLLLRPNYEAALAKVLTKRASGAKVSVAELDGLEQAAAAYAATPEGFTRVTADAATADTDGDVERSAVLRAAANKGAVAKAAADQAAAILKPQTAAPKPTMGQRPMKEWSADSPIWPKKEDVLRVISATSIRSTDEALALKAFRSLFAKAWKDCFYLEGSLFPVGPYSDEEGWRWRRHSTDTAARKIAGAESVTPKDLTIGMCVYTGFGVKVVSSVSQTGTASLADASGAVSKVATFSVSYKDGKKDDGVPATTVFIRLPALEKKADKPKPDKKIDFS
jgi:hypothetical protein